MSKFLLGLILGLVIVPVAVVTYVSMGKIPVGADEGPMPFERYLAGNAVHARVKMFAPKRDIGDFKPADLVTGAGVYQKNCASCHGLPQQPPSPLAGGMFPDPPQLFTADGMVTDDPVGVTYWKVQNGIRLSGMPSFKAFLTDQQMWDVSAVMALADKLPPAALDALRPAAAGGATPEIPAANSTK